MLTPVETLSSRSDSFTFRTALARVYQPALLRLEWPRRPPTTERTKAMSPEKAQLLKFRQVGLLEVVIDEGTNVVAHVVVPELGSAHDDPAFLIGFDAGADVGLSIGTRIGCAHLYFDVNALTAKVYRTRLSRTGKRLTESTFNTKTTMPTNHAEDQTRDHLAARVDTNKKHALALYAHKLNGEDPYKTVKLSTVVRGAVDEYISRHWDDLPEEAKDALDEDLLADAGEGARGAIVE